MIQAVLYSRQYIRNMEKSIVFKGISLDRSDQLALDGELAYCNGAEIKDGTLRPAVINKSDLGSTVGELLFVHTANGYTHYICRNDAVLVYYLTDVDGKISGNYETLPTGSVTGLSTITSSAFTSLGNTLVINSPGQGLFYILWQTESDSYEYLGQQPPMISIDFMPSARPDKPDYDIADTLQLTYFDDSGEEQTELPSGVDTSILPYAFYRLATTKAPLAYFTEKKSEVGEEGDEEQDLYYTTFSESDRTGPDIFIRSAYRATLTEAVWALINKTNSHIAEHGRFYAPFFVRYTYRLYDGSTYMHSAPVLVAADLDELPQVSLCNVVKTYNELLVDKYHIDGNQMYKWVYELNTSGHTYRIKNQDDTTGLYLCYKPIDFYLQYMIESANVTELKKWSDVIQSVDIFISSPLVWYNDSEELEKFTYNNGISLPQYINSSGNSKSFYDFDSGYKFLQGFLHCVIPRKYPDGKDKRFSETSAFYLLKSIKLDDLNPTSWVTVDDDNSIINNITTREQMKDEYNGHSKYMPSGMYNYNHRLHIYGAYRELFEGFPIGNLRELYYGSVTVSSVAVKLVLDSGIVWVTKDSSATSCNETLLKTAPMFYPDTHATIMQLTTASGYIVFDMYEHTELNGSITDPSSYRVTSSSLVPESSSSLIVPVNDSLLVSEADNPFTFPAENVSTIGNGKILGLCSATRALSQGQFGSFPLMAFATDGIWAMETSAAGKYTAVNPISREVAAYNVNTVNSLPVYRAKAILQLDQSIVFATDRGLCQLAGSEVLPISDALKGRTLSESSLLGLIPAGVLITLQESYPCLKLTGFPLRDLPVISGSMDIAPLYDYVNHRLLLFPSDFKSADEETSPCLVYHDSDKQYTSLFTQPLLTVLNSYPYPYIQTLDGNNIYRLDKQLVVSDDTSYSCVLVTRHLSLGSLRDAITAIRHEKDFSATPLMIIFGSNDAVTDHYVGCFYRDHVDYLAAHPFRYFRILMVLQMKQYERYSALVLGVTAKHSKL